MKRFTLIFICICILLHSAFSQADEYPSDGEESASSFDYISIRKGSQFIKLGLGVDIPLLMQSSGGAEYPDNINVGGSGCIGYYYYFTRHFSLGGELNFQFNTTLAENVLFRLPILLRPSYTFVIGRVHVPIGLGLGGAFQSYDSRNYFNVTVQPEIGAYYIFSPEWSFGTSVSWDVVPQWYGDSDEDRTGHFLNVYIGVRYHF